MRGYRDWLNVRMSTLWPSYFLMMAAVSSSVLNEFIRMMGTFEPYVRFRYSTWRTDRSRKDMPSRTSIDRLGADAAHRRAEAAVELEHRQLVEEAFGLESGRSS